MKNNFFNILFRFYIYTELNYYNLFLKIIKF